jgi:rod shape-determining protein MreC
VYLCYNQQDLVSASRSATLRRNWQSNRFFYLLLVIVLSSGLIALSFIGILAPIEDIVSAPIYFTARLLARISFAVSDAGGDFATLETLQQRNAELEVQLAELQGELINLREIASDYERLASLLEYTSSTQGREYITADVIGQEQYGFIRSIIINQGTRSGITVGMPVVTDQGLVGRVFRVTASTSQVQLVTDRNSFISSRLQSSRIEGTIVGEGLETGSLEMRYIPLNSQVLPGDLIVTTGLGGNFPPDLVVGQVISVRNLEFELTQNAQVASLIDFSKLEFVLVITSFEPADLSVFDTESG